MNVHLKALNIEGEVIFEGSTAVDAMHLFAVVDERTAWALQQGPTFIKAAVPFFAATLLKAAQRSGSMLELNEHVFKAVLAACLADLLFDVVSEDEFANSNLHFTLLATGAVKYDRISTGL